MRFADFKFIFTEEEREIVKRIGRFALGASSVGVIHFTFFAIGAEFFSFRNFGIFAVLNFLFLAGVIFSVAIFLSRIVISLNLVDYTINSIRMLLVYSRALLRSRRESKYSRGAAELALRIRSRWKRLDESIAIYFGSMLLFSLIYLRGYFYFVVFLILPAIVGELYRKAVYMNPYDLAKELKGAFFQAREVLKRGISREDSKNILEFSSRYVLITLLFASALFGFGRALNLKYASPVVIVTDNDVYCGSILMRIEQGVFQHINESHTIFLQNDSIHLILEKSHSEFVCSQ